jgi:hypothetical protein
LLSDERFEIVQSITHSGQEPEYGLLRLQQLFEVGSFHVPLKKVAIPKIVGRLAVACSSCRTGIAGLGFGCRGLDSRGRGGETVEIALTLIGSHNRSELPHGVRIGKNNSTFSLEQFHLVVSSGRIWSRWPIEFHLVASLAKSLSSGRLSATYLL